MKFQELLSEVRQLKGKGIKTVELDRLEAALVATNAAESKDEEWKIKLTDLKHQSDLAAYEAGQNMNRSLLEAAIAFAGAALKSALLINGGAAVAMLAYLGNTHSGATGEFPYAMLMYTGGVLLAAMGTGGSYLAQYHYAKRNDKVGDRFRSVAIALIIVSYVAFALGSHTAYLGFVRKS
jgi:hypothetical protein